MELWWCCGWSCGGVVVALWLSCGGIVVELWWSCGGFEDWFDG